MCCYDKESYPEQKQEGNDSLYGTNHITRAIRDMSIASSFITLRATSLGLGTCYVGWMNKKKAKQILEIEERYEVLFVITIGYPDEKGKERKRLNIEEILL